MGTCKKTSLAVFVIFLLLSFFISKQDVTAQDFLKIKKFLSSSSIKKGKQFISDGDYPSAITEFTKSIKKKHGKLEAHYQLGLIFEDVFHNYEKALSMYKNVISLSEGLTPTGTDDELKEFNTLITNARNCIDRVIKKKFESIEKPNAPIYIIVKTNKKVFKEPSIFSPRLYKSPSQQNEFRLLNFKDNWYQINISSIGLSWIPGKNVLKILQKNNETLETSLTGKAAQYERFVSKYPNSRFTSDAKERAYSIYYELAKNNDTINSYSVYLEKYPDGKEANKFRLRKDELTFQDKDFLNNVSRLQAWIEKNPESTFL
ncbi:MAG: tetratricopeptide repeat protein, partial [Planctomycetota bacterium]